jgi:glycosyltransferase EpsD
MGVITRLAARKKRKQGLLKVLYMAHGFHFFKGAPLINWLLFYPVEYLTSFLTDCLVTVNHEDFNRAKNFHAKQVKYIHGIGINTDRLNPNSTTQIRDELNLDKNSFLILSVGELNKNKNQQTIIKAFAKINNQNMHYVLCGKGDQEDNLRKLTEQLNLSNRVHFLGYRTDVVNICAQSDVFVMPSLREGLPVASLEAMYCGLPLITSNIRGLVDIMQDGVSGYLCKPTDVNAFSTAIINLFNNKELQISAKANNTEIVKPYLLQNTKTEVLDILKNL